MFSSLRHRLIFGFTAVILLFAGGVLITLLIVDKIGEHTEQLVNRYWMDSILIGKTHALLGEVALYVSGAAEKESLERSRELQDKIAHLIGEIEASSFRHDFRKEQSERLRQLRASLSGPVELLNRLKNENSAADAALGRLLRVAAKEGRSELAHDLNVAALAYRDFFITANPSDLEIFRRQLRRIGRDLPPEMVQSYNVFRRHGERVFAERMLLRQSRDEIRSHVAELSRNLHGRSELYLQRVVQPTRMEIMSDLNSISTISLAAIVAAGLASLAVAVVLARRFSSPMEHAVTILSRIEGGDLSARFPAGGDLESDRLGRAVNSLAVSLHKALEDQQETMQRLVRSKTRFREIAEERQELERIINASPAIAFFVHLDGSGPAKVTFMSQSIRQLGYAPDDFLTGQRSFDSIVHPDDAGQVEATFANHLKDGRSHGFSIDLRILDAHGAIRVMDGRILIQRNDSGIASGYQGVLVDETDKERIREQAERIGNLAALGELAAGVAHEINNPNATILFNIALLKDLGEGWLPLLEERFRERGDFMVGRFPYTRVREEIPQLHAEIADSGERIRRIVEDMKSFTRQTPDHTRQLLDLNEVAQAAIRLSASAIKNATDRFRTDFAAGLPPVAVNRQQMEQVIVNLLINACQALTKRDEAITLGTSLDASGAVCLAVIDEGRGIPAEHLAHVTDPFFTTRRDRGGTGLGLSISARIVHDHRGELAISSPGRGTSIRILLPAADGKDCP